MQQSGLLVLFHSFHRKKPVLLRVPPVLLEARSCIHSAEERLPALLQLMWDSFASTVLHSIATNQLETFDWVNNIVGCLYS